MAKVSVVVPTYRRENELRTALNSLAAQTHREMEIILVDDNGNAEWNQKVAFIAEEFHQNNPQIAFEYIANSPNLGSSRTRNIGIEAASGEYVTFLDDDDVYLPGKIENQVEFMEHGGYDYSITDLFLYSENDRLIDRRIRSYIRDTSVEALQCYHLKHHLTGTDTMMFRKAYLEKIGGFAPIDVGDEYYLMQRAITAGGKFGYYPKCDVKAYVHTGEGGLSSGDGKIRGENALFEYKKGFFDKVDAKTRRYISMRHYAVIAFAELRRKKLMAFVMNAARAFFCSPVDCVKMLLLER